MHDDIWRFLLGVFAAISMPLSWLPRDFDDIGFCHYAYCSAFVLGLRIHAWMLPLFSL